MHQLILVRHAQTQANTEGRWQGQKFDGLVTPLGQRQIEAVARRLTTTADDVVALYTSPLGRALQTARSIGDALGLDPVLEPDLREMDFGELDSWTMDEIAQKRPDFFQAWLDRDNRDLTWPGGESRRDFTTRASQAYRRILQTHPDGTIVVVAHGGSLGVGIISTLGWPPNLFATFTMSNCGLTRLVYRYERWILQTLNDTCHLDGLFVEGDPAWSSATGTVSRKP
jgi:probable phosphoglycerate mutase